MVIFTATPWVCEICDTAWEQARDARTCETACVKLESNTFCLECGDPFHAVADEVECPVCSTLGGGP